MNKHGLVVGQRLWFERVADRRYGSDGWYEVTKIGRKWATVAPVREDGTVPEGKWYEERANLETLRHDSGEYPSCGTFHVSKEACQEAHWNQKCWQVVQRHISNAYQKPADLTIDDIQHLAFLLGVDLPEREESE